jgi:hypothetical protein
MVRGLTTIALASIMLLAGAASASSFQFTLTLNEQAHTFDVWGSASPQDNAGLASFSIDLLNIDTARVVAPMAFDRNELRLKGFVTISPALADDGVAYGSQNLSDPNSLLLGIGQTAGSVSIYPGSYAVGVPWTAPVRLVTGTYSGAAAPAVGEASVAEVFSHAGSLQLEAATFYVPEPTCALWLLLGCLAAVKKKWRKN